MKALKKAETPAGKTSRTKPYQIGTASWYGSYFQGRATASGEPYDMYDLTAAHPTLPLGSWVRVTNLHNGRAVVVRINDRGPIVPGRIIDLSYNTARVLHFDVKRLAASAPGRHKEPHEDHPAPDDGGPAILACTVQIPYTFLRMYDPRQNLIVALDVSSAAAAQKIVAAVGDSALTYKVGMQLYTGRRPQRRLRPGGFWPAGVPRPEISRHSDHSRCRGE